MSLADRPNIPVMHVKNHDGTGPEIHIESFYQIAYCSVLKQQMDEADVQQMVAHSQRNNQARGITGMMMIDQGLVIQWLEGSKDDVRQLWAKLQKDNRHHCIVQLLQRDFTDTRLFPDWSMQRTTREDMLAIVHSARENAERGEPTPWAGAIATMCILIDPEYAKTYGAALSNQAAPASRHVESASS